MLVGFIGAPCAGKTTTAARLFAELKEAGQPAEFISEKARSYIANKRVTGGLAVETPVPLTDEDQILIAKSQYRAELVMNFGNQIVVTDSCVLNSLLYMSPSVRGSEEVRDLVQNAVRKYDLVFLCAPVPRPQNADLNRVHDEAASLVIHNQIEAVLVPMLADVETYILTGNTHARAQQAFSAVLNKFASK